MRSRAQSGHSLIELMIASMVFTVGALGLAGLIYTSAGGVTTAEKVTHATALARSRLDLLQRLPYDDPLLDEGSHNDGANNLDARGQVVDSSAFGANDGLFARSWVINADPDPDVSFKTIMVNVRWWDKTLKRERIVRVLSGVSDL